MSTARPSLVVSGEVVLAAQGGRLETAEAIGIDGGRVVVAGSRRDVMDAAGGHARQVDAGAKTVVPGVRDAHLHLAGMARARRAVQLDDAADFGEVVARVADMARGLAPGAWLTGRGWGEATLDQSRLELIEAAAGGRPAMLTSHDGHSAWASAEALRLASVGPSTADPPGGRIERDAHGGPNGVLRETARELVTPFAGRLHGADLAEPLAETLAELAALGITAATDAGDPTDAAGTGEWSALGDSFSSLAELAEHITGRLRLTLNLPADAIPVAAERGLRSGQPLLGAPGMTVGWAKVYGDGALGSRTAALFEPYTCGDGGDTGILRVPPERLDAIVDAARGAGIGLAIHAIGDRTVAAVLDALERPDPRDEPAAPDRIEHVQLARVRERARLAALGVTASMQPIHAASDRRAVETCWGGRQGDAYAWRSLQTAGGRLAFGSDGPIESENPWLGCFAAVHRRFTSDPPPDWRPEEAIEMVAAIGAYTTEAGVAAGRPDEGHLRPGARADLAVLNVDLATLLAADERLASVRSDLTLVGGREVHIA